MRSCRHFGFTGRTLHESLDRRFDMLRQPRPSFLNECQAGVFWSLLGGPVLRTKRPTTRPTAHRQFAKCLIFHDLWNLVNGLKIRVSLVQLQSCPLGNRVFDAENVVSFCAEIRILPICVYKHPTEFPI